MTEREQDALNDILDAIGMVESWTYAGREAFDRSDMMQSAVVYQLLVIGEAVGRLSEELTARRRRVEPAQEAPEVTWRMGIDEVIGGKRQEILALARQHGAYNVRVFGSVARGEATAGSDVDLLVDVQPWVGLEFLGLWDALEDLLGRKVDLVTEQALKPRLRARVLREVVAL